MPSGGEIDGLEGRDINLLGGHMKIVIIPINGVGSMGSNYSGSMGINGVRVTAVPLN